MTISTPRRLVPATLALALVLGGCTNDEAKVSTDTLASHAWSLVSATDATGKDAKALTDGEQAPIKLLFQAERLSVANACNNMSGPYQLKDTTLEIGNLAQTMMACEPVLMAREEAIKTYLEKPLTVKVDDSNSRLTLSSETGKMVFEANDNQTNQ